MWKLSYPIWEDLRVIVVISIAISMILFAVLCIFTDKFQCSTWIIFMPALLSVLGSIIGFTAMLLAEGKNGVLQHIFLGVFTYSICVLFVSLIIASIVLLIKDGICK